MHCDARLGVGVGAECHASDSLLLLLDQCGEAASIASNHDWVTLLGILTHAQGSHLLVVRFDCLLNLALDNHWHVLIDFENFDTALSVSRDQELGVPEVKRGDTSCTGLAEEICLVRA